MNKIICSVDSRERERIPYSLKFFKKYKPSVLELETGDYIFNNKKERICFEYKTINDFIGSITDGRIFEQVMRMQEDFDWNFVVIEGTIEDLNKENRRRMFQRNTGKPFTLNQFYGAIARLNCHVTVVQCHNQAQAFNYMEKQVLKIFDDNPLSKHVKSISDNPPLNYLTSINGIGYKTGKLIVDEFNIKNLHELVVIANTCDLTNIKGISDKTAHKIKEAII